MKPILIYDGNCGFCLYWIDIWGKKTKDRVEYAPYQSVSNQFPQVSLDQFKRSVQLVKPNGEITEGAKAVFEILAYNPSLTWLLKTYQNFCQHKRNRSNYGRRKYCWSKGVISKR